LQKNIDILKSYKQRANEEILKKYSKDLFGFPPNLQKNGKVTKKGQQANMSLLTKMMS